MSNWTQDWVAAGRAAEKRADRECERCGARMTVGYSNLGIPVPCCPACSPALVATGKRPVGDVWGFNER